MWVDGMIFPSIEHIVPLSEGGTNFRSNLTLVCSKCQNETNTGK